MQVFNYYKMLSTVSPGIDIFVSNNEGINLRFLLFNEYRKCKFANILAIKDSHYPNLKVKVFLFQA